jgi:multidrug resistance protein, MATE family
VVLQPVDAMNSLTQGVLQGVGRQGVAAVSTLVSYWGVGLPLAAVLTFKAGANVQGLWAAVLTATGMSGGWQDWITVKLHKLLLGPQVGCLFRSTVQHCMSD